MILAYPAARRRAFTVALVALTGLGACGRKGDVTDLLPPPAPTPAPAPAPTPGEKTPGTGG